MPTLLEPNNWLVNPESQTTPATPLDLKRSKKTAVSQIKLNKLFHFRSEQQYLYFPLPHIGLTGLKSGTGELVSGHKDYGNVSLVVNDIF